MKIVFLLPGSGDRPVGGFKVAYEYANGLAQRGHEVVVLHAPYGLRDSGAGRRVRSAGVFLARSAGLLGGFQPDKWFKFDHRVDVRWTPSLHERWIPQADAVVATAWETAEWASRYPANRGARYYLIQHLESMFRGSDHDRVEATWKAPLQKIVISQWLLNHAQSLGETAEYIPNGLDFSTFGLDDEIETRDANRVMMLYHHEGWKGSEDGLKALLLAKEQVPELTVTLFGVPLKPQVPDWITYHYRPRQNLLRKLYNQAAIFVAPSHAEGWPLPPAESAQCGCALAITDIGGHREYAEHNVTALLSPIQNPTALADNIVHLLRNPADRIRLAHSAHANIQQFTWSRAVNRFEEVLLKK